MLPKDIRAIVSESVGDLRKAAICSNTIGFDGIDYSQIVMKSLICVRQDGGVGCQECEIYANGCHVHEIRPSHRSNVIDISVKLSIGPRTEVGAVAYVRSRKYGLA